jgi:protein arginine kinase activator
VQGGTQHTGKIPSRTGGTLMVKGKIQQLRQELQRYISREEFEKAAQVRDQIKELDQQLKGVE